MNFNFKTVASILALFVVAMLLALGPGVAYAATRTAITTGVQTVTATGAVTGTLDTSGFSGDYTIKVRVASLSSASGTPAAIIAIQDTANASAFSDAVDVGVFHVKSTVRAASDQVFTFRQYQVPNTRYGVTNAKLRINVLSLSGTTPSLRVESWLEQ